MKYAHSIQNETNDCGVAAIQTVLSQLKFKNTNLARNLEEILKYKKYSEKGLSLYDLQEVLGEYGVEADCYEVADFEELRSQRFPQIVTVKKDGLPHYCVIHEFNEGSVWISDPSELNVFKKEVGAFQKEFMGYAICIDEVEEKTPSFTINKSYPEQVIETALKEIPNGKKLFSMAAILAAMFLPLIATYGLEYLSGRYVDSMQTGTIALVACFVAVLIILCMNLMRYNARFKTDLSNVVEQKVLTKLFDKYLGDMDAKVGLDNLSGYFWNCITASQGLLERFYLIVHLFFSVLLVLALAKYSWLLAMNLCLWSFIFYLCSRLYIKKSCLNYKAFIANSNRLSGTFEESIRTTLDIQAFSKDKAAMQNFQNKLKEYFNTKLEMNDTDTIISALIDGTRTMMILTHFILFSFLFKTGHLNLLAGVVSGVYVLYIATSGLSGLFGSYFSYIKSREAIEYIEAKNDFDKEMAPETINIEEAAIKKIELEDVSFSYEEQQILRKGKYTFESGNIYSIVGKNGVGKSTLIKLLSGLLDNQEGSFRINSHKTMKTMKNTNIFDYIAYYSTEMEVYNQSVESNITYSVFDEDKAALSANHYSFTSVAKDHQMDDLVSSSGRNISQGQKQKLLLLRTLNKEADIYIFDEPTGNLDVETREEFIATIHELTKKKDKLVLIVTHTEEIVKASDVVYQLNGGESE
ncbi:ATP-binding cassette domain-containing protein [Enterococcus sp. LJL51]|uniref:ATP-binding cassette domain-containing protein n=1 Tax=Enterococcus sp. LJL51 TaxID=3416656 RepID=UPI003CF51B08